MQWYIIIDVSNMSYIKSNYNENKWNSMAVNLSK